MWVGEIPPHFFDLPDLKRNDLDTAVAYNHGVTAKQLSSRVKKQLNRGWFRLTWPWKIGMVLIFLAVVTVGGLSAVFLRDLPSPTRLRSSENLAVSTQIFDRHGTLLYEIFADENRTPIEIDSLPEYMPQATIAIEDKNFYRHFGLDFVGITRAIVNNVMNRGSLQGGSTITQQLVKVSLLSRERTLQRKAKEAVLTVAAEVLYSKDDILEMYLNHVPYGGTAWGVEAAAQTYFDKPAQDLTLAEASYLAGLPQSPTRYSPYGNTPELGLERQKEVLRRMVEDKYITQEEADAAMGQELAFAEKRFEIQAPHFVFYVRDRLVETYGQAMVERGGLRVTTTLDLELQETAQASLSAEIADLSRYDVGNGAALVTKPTTGEILAMVGSQDYFDATAEGQINMTVRLRQPGSSMKPLNLATAFQERRADMSTVLLDIPTCFKVLGQADYCPRNYDGTYRGPVTVRQALANSYNIPAVKLGAMNGVDTIIDRTRAMGLTSLSTNPDDYGISLALGAGEVSMLEMATAFGSMANQGVKVPLIPILKVETYTGEVLQEVDLQERREKVESQQFLAPATPIDERSPLAAKVSDDPNDIYRVLDPEVAYLVSDIISDNQARTPAFGATSQLRIPNYTVAVKTGTTNDLRDNWTIGYTPEYLVASWVGNTDNSPMNPYLVSGVTGAAPIWNDIMGYVLRSRDTQPWPQAPSTITEASFCRRSGALPSPEIPGDKQCETVTEKFWAGTEPQETENVWNGTWIAEQTGLPPGPDDPTDKLKFEEHILLSDPFTRDYCQDCVRQTVEVINSEGQPEQKPVEEKYTVPAERLFTVQSGYYGWE